MRLSILIFGIQLSCLSILFASDVNAQVTLDAKQSTIKSVFAQIERQANIKFTYNEKTLKDLPTITLKVKDRSLNDVLVQLGQQTGLRFQQTGKLVAVSRAVPPRATRVDSPKTIPDLPDQPPIKVSGKVVDENNLSLPGATVRVKGSNNSTSTDVNGEFTITLIPPDLTLAISFVGYKTKELAVSEENARVVISMEPESSSLSEITVMSTGYQEIPFERATGSFSKVDNQTYNRQVSTDVITRLKSIAPSLLFDQRNGQNNLTIRGISTIFANSAPLIVLDNFPYDGDINNINPNDIESITILKDAAAASIWGVRAGNGVIVLTTKKGRSNQPPKVEINTNVTAGKKPDLFYLPKMSTGDFIDMERFLFDRGYFNNDINNTTTRPPLSPVVEILTQMRSGTITQAQGDAQINELRSIDIRDQTEKYYYQASIKQQHNFNLQGGSEKHHYYFSSGLDKNRNAEVGNSYQRFSITTRQQFKPYKNLTLNADIFYTRSNSENNSSLTAIDMGSKSMYPYARFADDQGSPLPLVKTYRSSFAESASSQGLLDWQYFPLLDQFASENKSRLSDIRTSAGLNYTIANGFSVDLKYQYENQLTSSRALQGSNSYFTRDLINRYTTISGTTITRNVPLGGILSSSNGILNSHNGRAQLNYTRTFGKHLIAAIGGAEAREVRFDGNNNRLYGYDTEIGGATAVNYNTTYRTYPANNTASIPRSEGISQTIDRLRSYYSNASYTFDDRYTLSLSGRIDQSNLFGVRANQRAVPLLSAGLKWNIDQEGFYKSGWLPILKARFTYGYNGNYDASMTAFTTATFANSLTTQQPIARISNPPNSELRWERSAMFNAGLDFGFLNNIISGSIEYYRKKGTDLIGTSPLDPTTGLVSFRGNVANMKGQGLDIELKSVNINRAFKWDTNLLFSYATDEVTKYFSPPNYNNIFIDWSIARSPSSYSPIVGRSLFGIYSIPSAGLDPATGNPRGYLDGMPSSNYAAISSAIAKNFLTETKYHGRALPPAFGAIRNSVGYKNWSASFNIGYRFGYFFRRSSVNYNNLFSSYGSMHSDYASRWQKPGDEQYTSVPSLIYPSNGARDSFYGNSDMLIEKGDNVRFQDVNLSYTIGASRIKHLQQAQVFIYANNLGLLWTASRSGLDPDFPYEKPPLSIAMGLKANF